MSEWLQLTLALVALIGVIVGPIVNGIMSERQAKRRSRHEYIDGRVNALIRIRANLQAAQLPGWAIANFPEEILKAENIDQFRGMMDKFTEIVESEAYKIMETNYGEAYSIMVSIDDAKIRARAHEIFSSSIPSDKLKVIDFALEQLGQKYDF